MEIISSRPADCKSFIHLDWAPGGWLQLGGAPHHLSPELHHSFSSSFIMLYAQVLAKWGEYSNDVQFILQRSPLDPATKPPASPSPGKETKAGPGGRRWGGPGSSPGRGRLQPSGRVRPGWRPASPW